VFVNAMMGVLMFSQSPQSQQHLSTSMHAPSPQERVMMVRQRGERQMAAHCQPWWCAAMKSQRSASSPNFTAAVFGPPHCTKSHAVAVLVAEVGAVVVEDHSERHAQ
jgi:hypothetical protein